MRLNVTMVPLLGSLSPGHVPRVSTTPRKGREYTASGQQVVGTEKLIVIPTDVTGER